MNFASEEYNGCKVWIAEQIQNGASWDEVKNLCVAPEQVEAEFDRLRYDELTIPMSMELDEWRALVDEIEGDYSPIVEMYGISVEGNSNTLPVPTDFFDIADIISRTNPRAVFLENVENLVSHDKGGTLHRIVTTLEDELSYRIIGVTMDEDGSYAYSGKSFIRNSKNFGLPQNRPRVYIIAFSKKMYGDTVKVLSEDMPFSGRKVIAEDLNSIIEPIVDDGYYMASGYWETLKKHKVCEKAKGHGLGYVVVNA